MANANVGKEITKTKASESDKSQAQTKPGSTWRKQPSVLKDSPYRIGDGEPDFVD